MRDEEFDARDDFDGAMGEPYWDDDLAAWVRDLPVTPHDKTLVDMYGFRMLA